MYLGFSKLLSEACKARQELDEYLNLTVLHLNQQNEARSTALYIPY